MIRKFTSVKSKLRITTVQTLNTVSAFLVQIIAKAKKNNDESTIFLSYIQFKLSFYHENSVLLQIHLRLNGSNGIFCSKNKCKMWAKYLIYL